MQQQNTYRNIFTMPKSDYAHLQGSTAQTSSKLITSCLQYNYRTYSSACHVTGALGRRVSRKDRAIHKVYSMPRAKIKTCVDTCVDMSDHNSLCKNEEGCHRIKEHHMFRVLYRGKDALGRSQRGEPR